MLEKIPRSIKVALVGMDERSAARMETIFRIAYRGRCEIALEADADLSIVDLDGDGNTWERYRRQYPGQPAIVMSHTAAGVEGATYVAKPTTLGQLWNSVLGLVAKPAAANVATENAADKKQAKSAGRRRTVAQEPVSPNLAKAARAMDAKFEDLHVGSTVKQRNGSEVETTLTYNRCDYLLGRILSSLEECAGRDSTIYIQCWGDRRLILLPGLDLAYSDLTDCQMKNLGLARLNREFTVKIDTVHGSGVTELAPSETNGLQSMPIDYLIWDLALRTSRGRVPEGTDEDVPKYLCRWPNFSRLPHSPNAMRIAAFWVSKPRTLGDVAENLGLMPAEVNSFYSAATAVGLIGNAKRWDDASARPRIAGRKGSPKRGFLNSILRHFGSKK